MKTFRSILIGFVLAASISAFAGLSLSPPPPGGGGGGGAEGYLGIFSGSDPANVADEWWWFKVAAQDPTFATAQIDDGGELIAISVPTPTNADLITLGGGTTIGEINLDSQAGSPINISASGGTMLIEYEDGVSTTIAIVTAINVATNVGGSLDIGKSIASVGADADPTPAGTSVYTAETNIDDPDAQGLVFDSDGAAAFVTLRFNLGGTVQQTLSFGPVL